MLAEKYYKKLSRMLILCHRIKGMEKALALAERTVIDNVREVLKFTSVRKGRKGQIKNVRKSKLKGSFIVAIQSNIEVLIKTLIGLVLHSKRSGFFDIMQTMAGCYSYFTR